jgi:hypothetical protein
MAFSRKRGLLLYDHIGFSIDNVKRKMRFTLACSIATFRGSFSAILVSQTIEHSLYKEDDDGTIQTK